MQVGQDEAPSPNQGSPWLQSGSADASEPGQDDDALLAPQRLDIAWEWTLEAAEGLSVICMAWNKVIWHIYNNSRLLFQRVNTNHHSNRYPGLDSWLAI